MFIHANCTIHFPEGGQLANDDASFVAVVTLPAESHDCKFVIEDVHLAPSLRGSIVASIGRSNFTDSRLTARSVRGLSTLITASYNIFIVERQSAAFTSALFSFEDVSLQCSTDRGGDSTGDDYVITTNAAASIVVILPATFSPMLPHAALISIAKCGFTGFEEILMPSAFSIISSDMSGGGHVQPDGDALFLRLGCNLWNGLPLPPTAITSNASLRRYVDYPASQYNTTVGCAGFPHTASTQFTISNTTFREVPEALTALKLNSFDIAVSRVALYASLLTMVPVAGMPSLQRAAAAIRLGGRCSRSSSASLDDGDEPMNYDVSENPLRLTLPVGADSLQYAAGAALGNALLACSICVGMHIVDKLQRHLYSHRRHQSAFTSLVLLLPSSLLPGSLAIPFGTLGQVSVSACIALLLSNSRTAASMMCGVMLLIGFWLAVPLGSGLATLCLGRRNFLFMLCGVPTVGANKETSRGVSESRLFALLRHSNQFLFSPREQWASRPKRGTPERRYAEFLLENLEAVFGAYVGEREWYFVVEWGVLVVSAAVLGAAEITAIDDAASACAAAQWGIGTVLALSAAQVVLCVWLRPFSVRAEFYVAVLLGTMSVVCQALALGGDVDASAQVDSVAAISEIVFIVVLMLGRCSSSLSVWRRRRRAARATSLQVSPTPMRSNNARRRSQKSLEALDQHEEVSRSQVDQLHLILSVICESRRPGENFSVRT